VLRATISDADLIRLDEPLTPSEYTALAGILEDHPNIWLRAYGLDERLATLGFLRYFPHLRRFSIANLYKFEEPELLNALPDDLEFLDVGETRRPLDLSGLRFERLRRLDIAGHRKGVGQVLSRNPDLMHVTLRGIQHDRVMPASLPRLEQLELIGGSVEALGWVERFPKLRHLALGRVRGVDDMTIEELDRLPALEWLRLALLPHVTRFPNLQHVQTLIRVDMDGMRGMRDADAVATLSELRNLLELEVTSSRLPTDAFRPLIGHPSLSAATIGLGSVAKNNAVADMLGVPPASSIRAFSRRYFSG
jgi:hypothetical protein